MSGLSFIKSYDFSRVIAGLVGDGLSHSEAMKSTEHLRAFMAIRAMNTNLSVPLAAWEGMDLAWHKFLEDKVAYESFCQAAFGLFLGHDANAYGTKVFQKGWELTVKLAAEHFNIILNPNPSAREAGLITWDMAAACTFMAEPHHTTCAA